MSVQVYEGNGIPWKAPPKSITLYYLTYEDSFRITHVAVPYRLGWNEYHLDEIILDVWMCYPLQEARSNMEKFKKTIRSARNVRLSKKVFKL